MSNPSAEIYGFEINEDNILRFNQNIAANKCENIKAIKMGISNKCGISSYKKEKAMVPNGLCSVHHLVSSQLSDTVETVSLDYFYPERNNKKIIVKIDVEGTESDVLSGMHSIIEHYKPTMIIEIFENNMAVLQNMINAYGYTIMYINERTKTLENMNFKQLPGSRNYLLFNDANTLFS